MKSSDNEDRLACELLEALQEAGALQQELDKIKEREAVLTEALVAARDHLEYCGYGDAWERECADHQGLPDKIANALCET